ncbi:MAG: leucine-rich repeat protein [Eubacteriales bacterium]|nr:leucine-rich repeat protein [Eubacteriales bacterium]
MKKVLSFVLIFALVLTCSVAAVPVSALTSGDFEYEVNSDGKSVTITECNDAVTSVVIPSQFDGYPVTNVSRFAFSYCYDLESITVEEGNNYFSSEDGVLFDKDKTEIIKYPVASSRTSYIIPESVLYIGDNAFVNGDKLESITLPENVKTIGFSSFEDCDLLANINIPDGVESIDSFAFWYCESLENIKIPKSVETIGLCAFDNCKSLVDITVDENNLYFSSQDGVLFDKDKTEIIQYPIGNSRTSYTIPESVTDIGYSAFDYALNLTEITIPGNVKGIGFSAFEDCSGLKTLVISEGVEVIGDYAFAYCSGIETVTIPASVESLGSSSFVDCLSVKNITVASGNRYYLSENGVLFDKDMTTLIQYPVAVDRTSYTVPDGVLTIDYSAFAFCESIEKVTIPKSVETIEFDAFWGCDKLTIYGEKDSAAESYAEMLGIAFVALGESAHGKVGDTNGDGKVTIADATQIQKHLANILKLEGAELEAADTNGDGKVTIADATQIQKFLANLIPSLG